MGRNFAFVSMVSAAGVGLLGQAVVTTRSDQGGNHALIIQSGPNDDKPETSVRRGPGYVVIEQHSNHNRAVIMQSD